MIYPTTRREPVTELLHGVPITDPYHWLEAGENPEVQDWTEAQNRLTDETLAANPHVERFAGRLREVLNETRLWSPVVRGGRLFFLRRSSGQNQSVLCMRSPRADEDRVLLNPNEVSDEGAVTLDWWHPSPDGRYLAFGYSGNGDEWSTLYILDIDNEEVLRDRIPRTRYASVAWEPDASGFYYTRYPEPGEVPAGEENYHRRLFYHKIGRSYTEDPELFGQGRDMKEMLGASLHDHGRYLLLTVNHGWARSDLFLLDRKSPGAGFMPLLEGYGALVSGQIHRGILYLLTNYGAPRYRLVAADPADPRPESWREVVPEDSAEVLQNFVIAGERLVVLSQKDVVSRIFTCDLAGADRREVSLPGMGTVKALSAESEHPHAYLTWESFTEPPSICRLNSTDNTVSPCAQSDVPVAPDAITVRQVFYTSRDGTRVPMFLLHRRDISPDGDRPTVLYGYGGFNISLTPSFSALIYPWLEQGGIYAIANLRGGSEYGEDWHASGMLGKKQNVFDDFTAAAEHLISAGWTRPGRLGIYGGSNGGLLVGAALTQRPDLFRAVICGVPLLDMLRYHKFLIGALWVSEYGSADDPEQFGWLHAYSPYHRVQEGAVYPATYIFTAASDTRVDPLHARKMAALLQHANGSEHPVLLRMEFEAGHGAGKPVAKVITSQAEIWGFLAWQLGLPHPSARVSGSG